MFDTKCFSTKYQICYYCSSARVLYTIICTYIHTQSKLIQDYQKERSKLLNYFKQENWGLLTPSPQSLIKRVRTCSAKSRTIPAETNLESFPFLTR